MTSRLLLFDILKYVLTDHPCSVTLDKTDLSNVYSLSLAQGVSGITFHGLRKAMQEHGIEKTQLGDSSKVLNKWFAYTASIVLHHDKILQLQNKLSRYLQEAGIKAIVLKGLSISAYYNDNNLRCFGDLDIFSLADLQHIDDILKPISTHFSVDYYRHSECNVDGVMVENHKYLTDVRGQSRFHKLERYLRSEAYVALESVHGGGLFYPNENFTFVFFVYHALCHFLYEKLSLRFLVDWCMMLKGRSTLTFETLDEKLNEFRLMKFAAVMTAVCIDKLGLSKDFVSNGILSKIATLDQKLVVKFEEDLFEEDYERFSSSCFSDRLKRGISFCKKSWKLNEFLETSTIAFLWEKFYAIINKGNLEI